MFVQCPITVTEGMQQFMDVIGWFEVNAIELVIGDSIATRHSACAWHGIAWDDFIEDKVITARKGCSGEISEVRIDLVASGSKIGLADRLPFCV
jgi:hypothetical protein